MSDIPPPPPPGSIPPAGSPPPPPPSSVPPPPAPSTPPPPPAAPAAVPPVAAPAAVPPPAPAKSRGGKGCLTAAIVGVVLLVVIGVGVVIGGRILIKKASDTLNNIGGTASPSSYEIKAEKCNYDGMVASFSGTIKNPTGSTKNFLLVASVTDSNGEDLGALPVVITGLAPGATKQWDFTVFGEPEGEITCKIQSVNNALN